MKNKVLFTEHLQQPSQKLDLSWMQENLKKYPYFQALSAIYLKFLHQNESGLYNIQLKKTAALTQDRDVLFEYITSDEFKVYGSLGLKNSSVEQNQIEQEKKHEPTLEDNIEKSIRSSLAYLQQETAKNPLLNHVSQMSISENLKPEKQDICVNNNVESDKKELLEEKLEIGKPLKFNASEKYSFSQWLQLTTIKPIEREEKLSFEQEQKLQKLALIDKFIENNPKIIPSKQAVAPPNFIENSEEFQPFLMTQTLAKIYLEQKKYDKAIQAYEILILKYPEKSSLFANRIQDIKNLQEYNL